MKSIKTASGSPGGRLIGVIYLSYFLLAILAQVLGQHNLSALSNATNVLSNILYLTLVLLFFFLFKPVNRFISLIAAIVGAAGCLIGTVGIFDPAIPLISPLWFFGPYCLLIGYLIFRSTFLPRILGVLMVLAGVGWLVYLSPLEKYFDLYIKILGVLAEASLMLWLIVKGIRPPAAPKPNSAPH